MIKFFMMRKSSSGFLLVEDRIGSQRKGGSRIKGRCLKLSNPVSGASMVMSSSLVWIESNFSVVGARVEISFDILSRSIWTGVA